MRPPGDRADFGDQLLAHLDAAHNLARWLAGNDQDAEEIVQEAMLRALRYQHTYAGGDLRCWLLAIVRNTAYSTRRKRKKVEMINDEAISTLADGSPTPEEAAFVRASSAMVQRAVAALPADQREVIVLRDIQGLAYKDIAEITGVPVGTVMSRLNRARAALVVVCTRPDPRRTP